MLIPSTEAIAAEAITVETIAVEANQSLTPPMINK